MRMQERKGLVLKVYEGKVLVLSEGDFIHVETNGKKYEKGQEITFRTEIETKKVVNWNRVISCATVPALVSLFLLIGSPVVEAPNLPTEKSSIISLKPVPKSNTTTHIEQKLVSVETYSPQKERNTQREENKQKEVNTRTNLTPNKDEEKRVTKPDNDEPKRHTENEEPVRKNQDRKENLPEPREEEPAPRTEPTPKTDSIDHDSDILTLAINREKISLSTAIIRVNLPLQIAELKSCEKQY